MGPSQQYTHIFLYIVVYLIALPLLWSKLVTKMADAQLNYPLTVTCLLNGLVLENSNTCCLPIIRNVSHKIMNLECLDMFIADPAVYTLYEEVLASVF